MNKRIAGKLGASSLLVWAALSAGLSSSVRADTQFPETGQAIYGPFEQYWAQHGGLVQFGMPRTAVFPAATDYDAQWFERALFTYNPRNPDPYKVELQLLGAQVTAARRSEAPFEKTTRAQSGLYFPETGHNLSGKFLAYWQSRGGLSIYGFPITEQFSERSKADGRIYTVQYFERNRLELHPELAGSQFEVQLGLLGSELLDRAGGPSAFAGAGAPRYYPTSAGSGVIIPPGAVVGIGGLGTPGPSPTPPPPAPALPPASGTVLYEDTFSQTSLTNWRVFAPLGAPGALPASWSVVDGALAQVGDALSEGTDEDAGIALSNGSFADFRLDTMFRGSSGDGVGALMRSGSDGFYLVRLFGAGTGSAPLAVLLKSYRGVISQLASAFSWPGYSPGKWQLLTVVATGAAIQVQVDGVSVLAATDSTLATGTVGLYARADGSARFDNFRIQSVTRP